MFAKVSCVQPDAGPQHDGGPYGGGWHRWRRPWHPQQDAAVHLHWTGDYFWMSIFWQKLCFWIFSLRQVKDEDFTAELLHAADKYELGTLVISITSIFQSNKPAIFTPLFFMKGNCNSPQVKLCASQFRSELTPESAADILLLADRHGLTQLKRVSNEKRFLNQKALFWVLRFYVPKILRKWQLWSLLKGAKLKMKKNPDLLIEMFSGKLFSKP